MVSISVNSKASIEERVKLVIVDKFGVALKKINPETNFIKDYGADSLDMFELMLNMEKEFGINIPDEEMERFKTVEEVSTYVKMKIVGLA